MDGPQVKRMDGEKALTLDELRGLSKNVRKFLLCIEREIEGIEKRNEEEKKILLTRFAPVAARLKTLVAPLLPVAPDAPGVEGKREVCHRGAEEGAAAEAKKCQGLNSQQLPCQKFAKKGRAFCADHAAFERSVGEAVFVRHEKKTSWHDVREVAPHLLKLSCFEKESAEKKALVEKTRGLFRDKKNVFCACCKNRCEERNPLVSAHCVVRETGTTREHAVVILMCSACNRGEKTPTSDVLAVSLTDFEQTKWIGCSKVRTNLIKGEFYKNLPPSQLKTWKKASLTGVFAPCFFQIKA